MHPGQADSDSLTGRERLAMQQRIGLQRFGNLQCHGNAALVNRDQMFWPDAKLYVTIRDLGLAAYAIPGAPGHPSAIDGGHGIHRVFYRQSETLPDH